MEVRAVGGYGEVGKNMTAIRVGDEVVVFDMGLHLPNYIKHTEEEEGQLVKKSYKNLVQVHAIPDDSLINDWRDKVVAIIPTHAHLDHMGAIPYMAQRYNCPIYCTGMTAEVIWHILRDEGIEIENEVRVLERNNSVRLSKNFLLTFLAVPHSVPDAIFGILETPEGKILYANDFKFDSSPVLGTKTNLKTLEMDNVKLGIIESLYAQEESKCPSEAVARELLKEVMFDVDTEGKALFVTTFSSHIARLKSIVEFAHKLNRKVVFLGRSLAKYIYASEHAGLITLSKDGKVCGYQRQIDKVLSDVNKNRGDYVVICTGHQGEPKSILSKITNGMYNFSFKDEDIVIFSCRVIPAEINVRNRQVLEENLRSRKVRIFKDLHVSGHAYREDLRDLISIVKPEHIIPSHSESRMIESFVKLGQEMGYVPDKQVHRLFTGGSIKL